MTENEVEETQEEMMGVVLAAMEKSDAGEEIEVAEAIALVIEMATEFAGGPVCACAACRKAAGLALATLAKAIDKRAAEDKRTLEVPWTPLVQVATNDEDGKTAIVVFCG